MTTSKLSFDSVRRAILTAPAPLHAKQRGEKLTPPLISHLIKNHPFKSSKENGEEVIKNFIYRVGKSSIIVDLR